MAAPKIMGMGARSQRLGRLLSLLGAAMVLFRLLAPAGLIHPPALAAPAAIDAGDHHDAGDPAPTGDAADAGHAQTCHFCRLFDPVLPPPSAAGFAVPVPVAAVPGPARPAPVVRPAFLSRLQARAPPGLA